MGQSAALYSTHEHALDLVLWTIGLPKPPTTEQIASRWTVSRATAYRWRVSLEAVHARASLHPTHHRTPLAAIREAHAQ